MPRVALLLVVALAACADETTLAGAPLGWGPASATLYSPPAGGSGDIVGDWLHCEDAGCTAVFPSGLRFAADGTIHEIWGDYPNGDESDPIYCISDPVDTYTWNGTTLTLHEVNGEGSVACSMIVTDKIAHMSCMDEESYFLRVSIQEEESCPVYYD
jgi:hypothetical protein